MLDVEGVLTVEGSGSMGDATAPWDAYHDQIKTVVIAEGVTDIGTDILYGVRQFTALTLPESVSRIDGGAFRQSGVREITFLGDAPSLSAANESLPSFPANAVLWYDPQQEGWDTPTLSGYACYPIGTVLPSGGDTDGDGFTTENDALLLAKILCGLVGTDEENRFSCDINGDHALNMQDVILILNEVKNAS